MGTSWMFLYEADIGAETCSQRASGSPLEYIFIKRDHVGNIKPDKEKSTEKIDGAVALIVALDRAIRCDVFLLFPFMMRGICWCCRHLFFPMI